MILFDQLEDSAYKRNISVTEIFNILHLSLISLKSALSTACTKSKITLYLLSSPDKA